MNVDLEPGDLWEELLRAGEVSPPSPEVLQAARAAVRRARDGELRLLRARRTRRRRLRYGLVAAAALAVLAIGAIRIDLGGHRVAGDAAAAATLRRAATATLAQHDPVVGPGQFLRIILVEQSWSTAGDSKGNVLIGRDGRPAAQQQRWTRTVWIPHDLGRRWTVRESTEIVRNATTDPRYRFPAEPASTYRTPSWAVPGSHSYVQTYDPSWYAELPRDPAKLAARLGRAIPGEGSGLAYDFSEKYSEVLRSGLAPADVRAALFEGLARTPGMEVLGDVTTLDGRSGIAIGVEGAHFAMVFDKDTGLYIGERATDPHFPDGVPGLDAAKTTWLTSVTTSVVDRAPRA